MRDNQYTTEGRIRFSEVDHTRRITLPGIVNYFRTAAHFSRKISDWESCIAASGKEPGSCRRGR